MEDRLLIVARARGGLVTVADARRLGVAPARLHRLRAAGLLVHLRRGAYAAAEAWADADPTQRYALGVRAVLRTRVGVAASHHAALAMARVPAWGVPTDRIDVVDLTGSSSRVRGKAGLFVRPRPVGCPIVVDDLGDPTVTVAQALVQVARDTSPLAFAVALDQALRAELTSTGEVSAALGAEDPRFRWVRQSRGLLEAADPLSPCVEASRLRIMLTDMGFSPRLRLPLRLADGEVVRPELFIGGSIAVSRTAYSQDRRERLRCVGVTVAVVDDADLEHPERVAAALAGAMRELDAVRVSRARGA